MTKYDLSIDLRYYMGDEYFTKYWSDAVFPYFSIPKSKPSYWLILFLLLLFLAILLLILLLLSLSLNLSMNSYLFSLHYYVIIMLIKIVINLLL